MDIAKDIYLIRHTTPAVGKGVCYGQTDLDVTESFAEEADLILRHLPAHIHSVHSSPLQRCTKLARLLFPSHPVMVYTELMEIHCGVWEMKNWDDIPREEIDPWMKDFVQVRIPGGESYLDLHERVTRCFNLIRMERDEGEQYGRNEAVPSLGSSSGPRAIIAHGGVIRSVLSYITSTPLIDSFKVFSLHYGCVVRVFEAGGSLQYETLLNKAPEEKEQHKPSSYYKQEGNKQ